MNEINNNFKTVEENFKKDFNLLYITIIEDNIKNSSIEIDIENILEEKEKNIEYHLNNSLFNNILNLNIPQFKLLSGLESNCIINPFNPLNYIWDGVTVFYFSIF